MFISIIIGGVQMGACWTSGAGSLERLGPRGLRRPAATSSSQRQGALFARQGLGFRVVGQAHEL